MSRLVSCLASLTLCLSLAACFDSDPADDDIVGPFTGPRTRFVVDELIVPTTLSEARQYAGDLNDDRTTDNQLGMVISTLIQQDAAETHVADRIAGGELAMSVEIQADDLQNDPSAGVWIYGFDGADARPVGGELVDGTFVPNFVKDTAPGNTGAATLKLPVIADADASTVDARYLEVSLVPDGNGGYDAQIHAAVRDVRPAAYEAIEQQLRERPEQHRIMWLFLDGNRDGVLADNEKHNALVDSLLAPDLTIAGEKLLSIGIGLHLIECPSGNCARRAPDDHCFDHVTDADEVDVDCGGSCGRCPSEFACERNEDCQSGTCNAGTCTNWTCFDGVKNGFEASADCGGACALKCELGAVCGLGIDCASGSCNASFSGGTGHCVRPN